MNNVLLWDFKEEQMDIDRFNVLAKPSLFDTMWILYCKDPKDTLLVPVFESKEEVRADFFSPKEEMMKFNDLSSRLSMSFMHEENRALMYESKDRWINMACSVFNFRIEENKLYADIKFLHTVMGQWLENNFYKAKFDLIYLTRDNRKHIVVSFLKLSEE